MYIIIWEWYSKWRQQYEAKAKFGLLEVRMLGWGKGVEDVMVIGVP